MSLFKRIFGKGGECKDPQSRAAEALDKKLHDLELDKYGIDPYTALLHVLEKLHDEGPGPHHHVAVGLALLNRWPQFRSTSPTDFGMYGISCCRVLNALGLVNYDETHEMITLTTKGEDVVDRIRKGLPLF